MEYQAAHRRLENHELVVGAVSALLLTDEVVLPKEWLGGAMIVAAAALGAHIHARDDA